MVAGLYRFHRIIARLKMRYARAGGDGAKYWRNEGQYRLNNWVFLFWSHSCKRILVDNKLDDFNHELLVVLRTRIFRMTRILSLWLFSLSALSIFGRFDSCSFQHLLELLRTRIIRMTRILSLRLFCLSALSIFGRFVWFVFVSTLAWVVTNTNISNDTNFEPLAL